MGSVAIQGSLVTSDACAGGCAGIGGDQTVFGLGDGACGCTKHYESIVNTGQALQVLTSGVPGAEFVDLDILDGFTRIELLAARTGGAKLFLRIGAAAAVVVGSGGTFPTTFAGGETLELTIDGVNFTTTFDAADQTAAQCAARINAAAALAGLATPRASVATSGELQIDGVETGDDGSIIVVGGTGRATLGLALATTLGSGADVPIAGDQMFQFPRDDSAPARIQVSGQGTISLLAGGRTS